MTTVKACALACALFVLALAPAVGAQGPGPGRGMSPEQRQEMLEKMRAREARLDALVAAMNEAEGPAKVDAIAAVVNELVAERRWKRDHRQQMRDTHSKRGTRGQEPPPSE